jgi:hypothetical protein
MQNLRPWEVDVPTSPIGAQKPFDVSFSGVRVLDTTYPYYFENEMKAEI